MKPMANWQIRLDIKDDWNLASERKISAKELASRVANKLQSLKSIKGFPEIEDEKQELIEELLGFSEDPGELDFNDFDGVMSRLYDWADTPLDNNWPRKRVCWIATNF